MFHDVSVRFELLPYFEVEESYLDELKPQFEVRVAEKDHWTDLPATESNNTFRDWKPAGNWHAMCVYVYVCV